MLDTPLEPPTIVRDAAPDVLERAVGVARIGFRRHDSKTVLDDLYQSGSAKLRLPRRHAGEVLEAVAINTSGGLTDGDTFTLDADWGNGAEAMLASQAAERIYRSRRADATIRTTLKVGDGATAFWLPQESILFDGGRVRRTVRVDLSASASFLGLESLVFGRTHMGETVRGGAARERFEIRRDGKLAWVDAFAISGGDPAPGGISGHLDRPAVGNGARAIATIITVGVDPERFVGAARDIKLSENCLLGVTNRSGVVVIRLLARDGAALRGPMMDVLSSLKSLLLDGRPDVTSPGALPRVWAL